MKIINRRLAGLLFVLFLLLPATASTAGAEGLAAGVTEDGLAWELSEGGTLDLSGTGAMGNYTYAGDAPWLEYADLILQVQIGEGVESIGDYAFLNCTRLTSVSIPESVGSIGIQAFTNCLSLTSVRIPGNCRVIGDYAFRDCAALRSVEFAGDAPAIGEKSFSGVTAAAYCSCLKNGWNEDTMLPYGAGKLTWSMHAWDDGTVIKPAACTEDGILRRQCAVCLKEEDEAIPAAGHVPETDAAVPPGPGKTGLTEGSHCAVCGETLTEQQLIPALGYAVTVPGLKEGDSIEIDGREYSADSSGRVILEAPGAAFAVKISWRDPGAGDIHRNYPTGMKVFRIRWSQEGIGEGVELSQLENVLEYAGASIRITGKKGIRMITAVPEQSRGLLTGGGVDGLVLLEYGTLVQWDSELKGGALTFSSPGVRWAAAYEKGKSDPIFARKGGKIQYTNVLVGFSDEQCGPDLAMRPYLKLQDRDGEVLVLYGGTVHRSIGYIALQNKGAFPSGTEAYEYIWRIIRNVYPDEK